MKVVLALPLTQPNGNMQPVLVQMLRSAAALFSMHPLNSAAAIATVGPLWCCACRSCCAAVQHKFGARTGLAPVLLGGMKVVLALLFGSSFLQLLQHFPTALTWCAAAAVRTGAGSVSVQGNTAAPLLHAADSCGYHGAE
jgi:hypothetical protein